MATRITVKINPDGTIETTVEGVKGSSCTALLDALTQQLGDSSDDRETAEFYEQDEQALEYN